MPIYTAFRLNIQSDFLLPELIPGTSAPDIFIRRGSLGNAPIEPGPIQCLRADQNEALLTWGQVGLALIRGGTEVVLDPAPGVHEDAIRLFICGAILGVLLHQRGMTVLHASAVSIQGKVVAFIGDKSAGKSSTAAALCARGHPLVTDDLLAIHYDPSGKPFVLFSYPQLKIWPDTAETLGMEPGSMARIRPDIEKRTFQSDLLDPQLEYPLHCVYVLGIGDTTEIFPLPPQAALFSLVRNIYVSRFGKAFYKPELSPTPFEQSAELLT
ncbi:MAG: hypothetical protein IH586_03925, partial [Anaerolineaceae bacterium]|nr:hypothetical protein [Anaerolineaceae bacterium]